LANFKEEIQGSHDVDDVSTNYLEEVAVDESQGFPRIFRLACGTSEVNPPEKVKYHFIRKK
jgi:hypothetical protein